VNDHNWTWRMPITVAALGARAAHSARIRGLLAARRARPLKVATP
jgi:hypothetical protein